MTDFDAVAMATCEAFGIPAKALLFSTLPGHHHPRIALSCATREVLGFSCRKTAQIVGRDLSQVVRHKQKHDELMIEDDLYQIRYKYITQTARDMIVQRLNKNGNAKQP